MHARTLSHLISTTLAVAGLSLGVTATAFAMPSAEDCACGGARVPVHSGDVPTGTGVGAPLSGSRSDAARHVAATMPRVDPRALTPPRTVAASADRGFQWDDAGIGAGGAIVLVLTACGATVAIRRRQAPDRPLAA
jgi:hypothetical protein